MEAIISPVDSKLILSELTPDKKISNTNKAGNEIYVVDYFNAPNTLREIGRLREITFRASGGGTGLSCDLDKFDTMQEPYSQLVLWDPETNSILGGYRFILGNKVKFDSEGQPVLATSHMFRFSEKFIKEYLPHTIELGRSFVTPEYQSSKAGAKAIFALDNLWDGLTALMLIYPDMTYFFGKMTMYPEYDRTARDIILRFLDKHFHDEEGLVTAYSPLQRSTDERLIDMILKEDNLEKDYRCLKEAVRRLGTNIPPLINSYMNSSPTMKVFSTGINDSFSDAEETAILINFDEMNPEKRDRHINSYISDKIRQLKARFPLITESIERRILEKWTWRRSKLREKRNAGKQD